MFVWQVTLHNNLFQQKVEFRRGENPGKKLLKKLKDMRPDKVRKNLIVKLISFL